MRRGFLPGLAFAGAVAGVIGAGVAGAPSAARADVQHTVARGHTIEAIANRYHVSAKAIMEANHIKDAKKLHPGDVLTIPGVKAPEGSASASAGSKSKKTRGHETAKIDAKASKGKGRETTSYARKPKHPGVIHVHRIATNEDFTIRVNGGKHGVSSTALKTMKRMMRSPSGATHAIEPRLVALLGVVSNHFGGRKIEVVSGFRPFTPTQYNPHSNHMHGKAIDFRVEGVPNEVVRDFCRTLKNTGCGYYPNSVFVHMDARAKSAFWIDYSKPGEPPRYSAPDQDADEGATEVHDEEHLATGATPGDATGTTAPSATPSTPAPSTSTSTAPSTSTSTAPSPYPSPAPSTSPSPSPAPAPSPAR
jgi:uncharacterized protein YcbK (DUF882 family)